MISATYGKSRYKENKCHTKYMVSGLVCKYWRARAEVGCEGGAILLILIE